MNAMPFDPKTEPYVNLATYRKNGIEVRTPVWIAGGDGRYYLFSAADAGKVKRIRANGKARLAACSFRGSILSEWLDAHASVLQDPNEIARAYHALRTKYGWKMALTDMLSKLSGRYDKRAIIEICLTSKESNDG